MRKDRLYCLTKERLENLFYALIMEEIEKRGRLESASFCCALYVSKSISELICKIPESLIVFDYFEKYHKTNNPFVLKSGADMCFYISSIFSNRKYWRTMKIKYYKEMGMSLYYKYYGETKNEIGYYMSEMFDFMSFVTKESLEKLKN